MHVNICSLHANFDALADYLGTLQFKFDFIVLSETWLSSDNHDLFSLSGYVCFFFPRLCKIGGDVAIFVKQCWNAYAIDYKNNVINFEFGIVKASNSCTCESYIVAVIYRSPEALLLILLISCLRFVITLQIRVLK